METIKPLEFKELKVGMKVEDFWCESGTILECSDIHNVVIEYDSGGTNVYCLQGDCENRDSTPLYKPLK